MNMTDPIADMLTRIRNGHRAGLEAVEMPHSKMKAEITRILKREGFIRDFVIDGAKRKTIRVYLKYGTKHEPAIRGLRRVSKPGLRKYVGTEELPKVQNGMGMAILSTSGGIMTDAEARERKVGGELLCTVW